MSYLDRPKVWFPFGGFQNQYFGGFWFLADFDFWWIILRVHENPLDKTHQDFRGFFLHGLQDLWKKTTKKHIYPFFEYPTGKFIEFDEFYFLDTFSLVDFWWILIFVNTENNPPEVWIHQKMDSGIHRKEIKP